MKNPSTKGSKGNAADKDPYEGHRNPDGTLRPGHPGGKGNPYAAKQAWLRSHLMNAATKENVLSVAENIYRIASGQDGKAKPSEQVRAAEVYFTRVLGPAAAMAEVGVDGEGGLVVRITPSKGDDDDDD